MITYYQDWLICPCGEQYIIKIPVLWASNHLDDFREIMRKQMQIEGDHYFCKLKDEVKKFFKNQDVTVYIRSLNEDIL